ncbi:galactose/methyl galactoside ABC transporter permease MglC [Clostridiaceae bacterium UIB06]|uniref:Galactose/methyl galactoside ABC transporter permease MglC n=1 Tax=Clostridium thailandense TaxID=2794346 RepID=A0A949TJ52_9CLOT|nr:galactose/methyl galactoside ABC transporter permease MglC [Clostridium thailandense]MBV7273255.1 galactose/methyl galactoside ABC transporter permease MglC [Clostridium thailandense]MCH5137948.1 galactose/methyl galactoside ABC transporter permease MglC [Clostridiaceae bacterium UIB06]
MENVNIKKTKDFAKQNAIYLVFIVLIIGIALKDPRFISLSCFKDILVQSSTRIIIALGAAFVILMGGADLSAGRVVGLTAVLSASMLQLPDYSRRFFPNLPHLPLIIPILIAIGVGLLVGLLNGYIVAQFSVPPFIATLGTMVIVYGANSIYFNLPPNNSQPIGGLRADFSKLGTGSFLGIPYIFIIAVIMTILIYIVLNKTRLGKNLYAIGGNKEAAIVSGINVKKSMLYLYVIAGGLYGLAGVLEAARTGGATNNYGNMYEMDAIAACVVGGWSVSGGVGTVPGVVIGVFIFSVINYGLTFIGVNPYWQQIIKGLIIVSAVAVDIRKYLNKK